MNEGTRWTVGCLIGGITTVGFLLLVIPVALSVPPPRWVQIAIGVALPIGGAVIAWLIASALRSRSDQLAESEAPQITAVPDDDPDRLPSQRI